MIAIKRDCLNAAELQRVLAGQMAKDEFDSAISHLDNCDVCRSAADAIQQEGRWIVESLDSDKPDPLHAETACQVALWRMLETPIANPAAIGGAVPCDRLGPYQLTQALGSGGMGTVYLAEHERLKRQCAIKLLPRERVDQPGWLERFDREMTTIAALEHPNVVRATDAGHEAGWHYLVMEYLDGLDVGRIASRMGQLQVADACEIVRQAALGLAHVHNSGLVHRDVKPSNLMLTRRGVVKILDLGLVLAGDDPLGVDDRLTTVGHLMGTMPYMAPEQLADSHEVDPRADIYSLGATLYRLIAARPPHQKRGGLASQVLAITNEDPPRLDTLREDVDRDVVQLVGEMLARDPAQRPKSAEEVAQRLAKLGANSQLKGLLREALRRLGRDETQPSLLPSVSASSSPPPTNRLRKWLAGGFFAALLLLAGTLIKIATDKGDLIVYSEHDGLTVLVKQGDEVVERLSIESAGEHRKVLRKGTYRVEIEGGGDALALSDEVVTIGRSTATPLRVIEKPKSVALQSPGLSSTPAKSGQEDAAMTAEAFGADGGTTKTESGENNELLFQGNSLDQWMQLLSREQDPRALGGVLKAVEVLTRDTDQRVEAALATLRTARRWGGIISSRPGPNDNSWGSSDEDPSHYYMYFLMQVYPDYLPDPGVSAIVQELGEGHPRSQVACFWLLDNFLTNVYGDVSYGSGAPEGRSTPPQWIEETLATESGVKRLNQLYASIQTAIDELKNAEVVPEHVNYAMDTGIKAAIRLRLMMGKPIKGQQWLQSVIEDRLAEAEKAWDLEKNGTPEQVAFVGMTGRPGSILEEDTLAAAAQLADGNQDANWAYFAATLLDSRFYCKSDLCDQVFQIVDKNAPDVLLKEIETRLESFLVPVVEEGAHAAGGQMMGGFGPGGSGGMMGGGPWLPSFSLGQQNSVWSAALPLYAKRAKSPPEAIALLKRIRERLKTGGIENVIEKPYTMIDAAIKTLHGR